MVSVVLVDDDARFRQLACRALAADGVTVLGEAADGVSAMQAVAEWGPEVLLLDIGLPDIDGLEVARRLRDLDGGPTVILISSRDSDYGNRVAAGVAAGFIRKDELSLDAIRAITGSFVSESARE